jgi:hypothetical protein
MTDKEYKQLLKEIKAYAKRVSVDKEEARRFLMSTGIYTETGELTEPYRNTKND